MQTIHPDSRDSVPNDPPPDGPDLFDELLDLGDRRRVLLRLLFGVDVALPSVCEVFDAVRNELRDRLEDND